MIDWIENHTVLGFVLYNELYIDVIPKSLLSSYTKFTYGYHVNNLITFLPELFNSLGYDN